MSDPSPTEAAAFVVARNPETDSRLPPPAAAIARGWRILKARGSWPATSRVYCHRFEGAWPEETEVVDEAMVVSCRRRGAAIDLVLDRPRLARSQFVFTQVKGREAIFWQTQKTARTANPGGRIPAAPRSPMRSRSPSTAGNATLPASRTKTRQPGADRLPTGDYAVQAADGSVLAAVERKSLDDLTGTLADGTLAFQLQRLAELPLAAVVVEASYSALYKLEHMNGNWLADQLARLEVRYPEVHLVFDDSRRFAEDWTWRFLTAALADASGPSSNG